MRKASARCFIKALLVPKIGSYFQRWTDRNPAPH
jgi:hypothetical protein